MIKSVPASGCCCCCVAAPKPLSPPPPPRPQQGCVQLLVVRTTAAAAAASIQNFSARQDAVPGCEKKTNNNKKNQVSLSSSVLFQRDKVSGPVWGARCSRGEIRRERGLQRPFRVWGEGRGRGGVRPTAGDLKFFPATNMSWGECSEIRPVSGGMRL